MIDPQQKCGLLDSCVLGVLYRGESHGYQIVKDLLSCIDISESTLYPILRRLETDGCLTVRSVEHNGRLRKLYTITERGLRRLDSFLSSEEEVIGIYDFVRRQRNDKA